MDPPAKPAAPATPIGERLSALLEQQGKTPAWLGDTAGVPRSTVHRILKGERKNPTPKVLAELAPALGVSLEQLVAGTDAAHRVADAATLVTRADYEKAITTIIELERRAHDAEERVRRAEDEVNQQRERWSDEKDSRKQAEHQKAEAVQEAERQKAELREARERHEQELKRYRRALTRAATDNAELRAKIAELGEAIDDSRKTGRVAMVLAGTAAAASVLTYLASSNSDDDE